MTEASSGLVHEWLAAAARAWPEKPALIAAGCTLTYEQLNRRADCLAEGLVSLGLSPHGRVVIFLDNSVEAVVGLYATLKAGGTFVVLNGSMKSDKLAYVLDDADAAVLITYSSKAEVVLAAMKKCRARPKSVWIQDGPVLPEAIAARPAAEHWDKMLEGSLEHRAMPAVSPEDLACLVYTSGSTGHPKAVMQPHGKVVSVAQVIMQYLGNRPDDTILNVLSLSFGYGLYQVLMSVMFGGTVVLERSFVFLHDLLKKIQTYQVTAFPIVPTMAAMLLNMKSLASYDTTSLRYITSAGAALPPEHTRRLRQVWPHVKIIPMHGLTECVRTCYLPPDQIDIRPDSVGVPIPGCHLSLVDECGREVQGTEVGEMVVAGPNVMPGYWRDPDLTKRVFRPGRVSGTVDLYTGDLFRRDEEGYLYFVSRKDDMIKTRGERVSPLEIERNLLRLEGIVEAAVVGIPDPVFGQVPKAFLVRSPESALTVDDVLAFASQNMEDFMIPRHVQFVRELPKTPNGKIDKRSLRQDVVGLGVGA